MKINMRRIVSLVLILLFLMQLAACMTAGNIKARTAGFELVKTVESPDLGGTMYYFKHIKTGAEVLYLDNNTQYWEFTIGFKTPPIDSTGANHVLEHALLDGSEKYPTKNLMYYIQGCTLSDSVLAFTAADCTYYGIKTPVQTEYYNLMDVWMNGIFHPLLLTDENIFRQEGIRLECVDGTVQYNGVVYDELKLKSFDTSENSLEFLSNKLYSELYGETAPLFNSGGTIDGIKQLQYKDLLRVYNTYYIPSNSMTYISGKQDISKALAVLNSFFDKFDSETVKISFEDTKKLPSRPVSEYNITDETQTVDIGFMSAGIMLDADMKDLYAHEIICNMIYARMGKICENVYALGGNSGGIQNGAISVSEIPIAEKDAVIAAYNDILAEFANGFDSEELAVATEECVNARKDAFTSGTDLTLFEGIVYRNDPFFYTNMASVSEELASDPTIFDSVLRKYFIETPYKVIVVSGNGAKQTQDDIPVLSDVELEKLVADTAAFNKWRDEKDDPAVIASIPWLTLNEYQFTPKYENPSFEQVGSVPFYYTITETDEPSSTLYFPIRVSGEELPYLQLLTSYLTMRADEAGYTDIYFDLAAMESVLDSEVINPQLCISLNPSDGNYESVIKKLIEFLGSDTTWDKAAMADFLSDAADKLMVSTYSRPSNTVYAFKQSSLSAGERFIENTIGSLWAGSIPYYKLLRACSSGDAATLAEKLRTMAQTIVLESLPTAELVGKAGYDTFKSAVSSAFANGGAPKGEPPVIPNEKLYPLLVTTKIEYENLFMLGGYVPDTEYEFSGKMNVLAKVLESRYLLPVLRGKYGAYGTRVTVYNNSITFSTAGLKNLEVAIDTWGGMGDFLRSIEMTQEELDAIILSAVKEYDEWLNDTAYGARMALCNKTPADVERVRDEILSATVEDIRSYADFIDALIAQNRLYAVLSEDDAASTDYPFGYRVNNQTLEITSAS